MSKAGRYCALSCVGLFWTLVFLGVGGYSIAFLFWPSEIMKTFENATALETLLNSTDGEAVKGLFTVHWLLRLAGSWLLLGWAGIAVILMNLVGMNKSLRIFFTLDYYILAGVSGIVLFATETPFNKEMETVLLVLYCLFVAAVTIGTCECFCVFMPKMQTETVVIEEAPVKRSSMPKSRAALGRV